MNTSEYQVTGMTCGHCEAAVRGEDGQVAGVESIDVTGQSGKLLVTSADPVDDAGVLAAVIEAGYEAVRVR